jgi:hypothetical protein
MAEKTIGLKIQLNGVDTVIKDVKTFEAEIKKAREDLKGIEIGTAQFTKLSSEIGLAESQMLGLIQSTKRLTKEREIEGIGKLGQGIASSFAAATAAVSLFGTESEEVQKAATAAQNLLTLALSARGIAEVKLGAQLVARTIAERSATAANILATKSTQANVVATEVDAAAQVTDTTAKIANTTATGLLATATNVLTASVQRLLVFLAANPYAAIIAAVGALVTAYIAFGSEQDQTIEKEKTLNELRKESLKEIQQEKIQIGILTKIIENNNNSLDARLGAYEQLKKLVPELANLTLDEARNQNLLNEAIAREVELIGLRAEQKALEGFIVQERTKQLEKEEVARKKIEGQINIEIAQETERLAKAGLTNAEIDKALVGFRIQAEAKRGLITIDEQLLNVTTRIAELTNQQNVTLEKTKKNTKDLTEAEAKRKKQQEELLKLLAEQLKLEAQLLGQTFTIDELSLKIIKTGEERISQAEEYTKALEKQSSVIDLYKKVQEGLTPVVDTLGKAFTEAETILESYFDTLKKEPLPDKETQRKLEEELTKSLNFIKKTFNLTEEESRAIDNLKLNYMSLFDVLLKFTNTDIKPPFTADYFEQTLIDYNLAIGKLISDPFGRTEDAIEEARRTGLKNFQELQKSFLESYEAYQKRIDPNVTTEVAKEAATLAFQNLVKTTEQILLFEQGVVLTNKKVVDLNVELLKLGETAKQGFLIANADLIAEEFDTTIPLILRKETELSNLQQEIAQKTFDEKRKYAEAISILEADLLAQGLDISTLNYEQRLELLEKFLKKEVEATEKAEKEKQDKQEETLGKIQKGLQMFSSYIGQIGSLVQQNFQLQLDELERSSKEKQKLIIGDTEQANQKRLELQEQYETERAYIEKRATIKALQTQLLQAIADGAQAVIQGFVDGGPILAGVAGILAGVQISIINKQLQAAQSLAGGGLIFGLPHEKGGVNAGGGVNVEGGEAVINKVSTVQYGSLLSSINQIGGGKPMINNAQNGLMEERLLQAIAKSNNEPIRAYVLNSEITSGQAINRRLSELASI